MPLRLSNINLNPRRVRPTATKENTKVASKVIPITKVLTVAAMLTARGLEKVMGVLA